RTARRGARSGPAPGVAAPASRLEATQARGLDAHRDGLGGSKALRRPGVARNEGAVLLDVVRKLVRRRLVRDCRIAEHDDDVTAFAVAIQVQGHTRALGDVAQLGG